MNDFHGFKYKDTAPFGTLWVDFAVIGVVAAMLLLMCGLAFAGDATLCKSHDKTTCDTFPVIDLTSGNTTAPAVGTWTEDNVIIVPGRRICYYDSAEDRTLCRLARLDETQICNQPVGSSNIVDHQAVQHIDQLYCGGEHIPQSYKDKGAKGIDYWLRTCHAAHGVILK